MYGIRNTRSGTCYELHKIGGEEKVLVVGNKNQIDEGILFLFCSCFCY